MKLQYVLVLSSTLVFLPWLDSIGQIYKWTDENGNVVFSERKPNTSKTEVETITPKVQRGRSAFEQEEFDDEADAGRVEDVEARERNEREVAAKNRDVEERNCNVSRDRLTSLQRNRVNEVADDGTRRVMGEDERQAEIAKAEAAVKEWCK